MSDSGYKITGVRYSDASNIVKCKNCGLVFSPEKIEPGFYKDYQDNEYLEQENGRRLTAALILNKIIKFNKGKSLLDIGCAAGIFLDEARKKGFTVQGIEPSHWAVEQAKNNFSLDIVENGFEEVNLPAKCFDVITMLDFIEHTSNPKNILDKACKVLKDDGIICISTPDIGSICAKLLGKKWWGLKQGHLFYFSRRTLTDLLKRRGFKIFHSFSYVRYFDLEYICKLAVKFQPVFTPLLRIVSKQNQLSKLMVKINFADQICVLARKA